MAKKGALALIELPHKRVKNNLFPIGDTSLLGGNLVQNRALLR
jgi:hypothetical protein